jgi:hypothetical protein
MIKIRPSLFLLFLFFLSCENASKRDFSESARAFLKTYAALFPDETPLSIDNENLANLPIPTVAYMDSVRQFYQFFIQEIRGFPLDDPQFTHRKDAAKMLKILANVKIYLDDYPHNPQRFNVLHGFRRILNADYASDEYRLQTLFNKLEHVPAFYEAAKAQLYQPLRSNADASVEQHFQTFLFFDETLTGFLKNRKQLTPQYAARLDAAKYAIKDYVAWVDSYRL